MLYYFSKPYVLSFFKKKSSSILEPLTSSKLKTDRIGNNYILTDTLLKKVSTQNNFHRSNLGGNQANKQRYKNKIENGCV